DDQDNRPQEKDFSGTIDELPRSLEAMMKNGHVTGFRRVQLTALEGQVGSLMQTERKPFATSATSTTYLDVGLRIKVTPQVTADGSVTLDLNVQDNRDRDSADQPGKPEFIMTSLAGKISVASGKAVLAKDAKVISKQGKGETLVIVGARVAESEAKT